MTENDVDNELLDYEDDEVENQAAGEGVDVPSKKDVKGSYVSIHSSGFRDFLLKPELLRAIVDCGFEHPSEGELSDLFCGELGLLRSQWHQVLILPLFSMQCNMSASHRQSWAWMSCARPSLAWARLLSSFSLHFNSWNQ